MLPTSSIARTLPLAALSLGLVLTAAASVPAAAAVPAAGVGIAVLHRAGLARSAAAATATVNISLRYHRDQAHTGYDPAAAPAGVLARAWHTSLDGQVQAAPLIVGHTLIAATERNSVYGLDQFTGRVLWRRNLGTPVTSGQPCGNINPLGITGTPLYDTVSHRLFAVATTPYGASIRHTLWGISPNTGQGTYHRVIDPAGQDPKVENQRGALALSAGRVLVPLGGHLGDCGNYHGYLMSVRASDGNDLRGYRTGTYGEAGMWQPSGPTVDGSGSAYVVTGNGRATSGAWDGGNAVIKLNPVTLTRESYFAPANWASGNATDSDLGSSGALLVGSRVWVQGKSATGYLLNQSALGGIGHPARSIQGACRSQYGGAASHGNVIFAPCPDGVRRITVRADGSLLAGWRAPAGVTGSPVVGGGQVWTLAPSAGYLYALAEGTGAVHGRVYVGVTPRFATPALSGRYAYVPTLTGITAVSGA